MQEYLYRLSTDKEKGFIAGMIKFFLAILSFIYGLLIRIVMVFRQNNPVRLSGKVISVGNITLGGTGKTVLVEYIARYLKEKGHKVAILTRGYKRRIGRSLGCAQGGCADSGRQVGRYEEVGDEAYMLAEKLTDIPVLVDADRIRAAKKAIRDYSADTLILDDGFQQWHIRKDLEIVVIDAQNPFGNKRIIPRGILREPLGNLCRADIFMLSKTNFNHDTARLRDFLKSLNSSAQLFESKHLPASFFDLNHPQEPIDLDSLRGRKVVLFCGIGAPDSFTALISALGINIGTCFKFPDHYHYSGQDIDNIIRAAKEKNIHTIITTEKDATRIVAAGIAPDASGKVPAITGTMPPMAGSVTQGLRFLVLRIKVEIKDEREFHTRLLGMYSG